MNTSKLILPILIVGMVLASVEIFRPKPTVENPETGERMEIVRKSFSVFGTYSEELVCLIVSNFGKWGQATNLDWTEMREKKVAYNRDLRRE